MIIGRYAQKRELEQYYNSEKPELIIVYGRRRVGKTYLIKEFFKDKFTFYFTGTVDATNTENLINFDKAIVEYGGIGETASANWKEAFYKLKVLLSLNVSKNSKKIVFIDEMPWLDSPKSDFFTAFDYFWNSWA